MAKEKLLMTKEAALYLSERTGVHVPAMTLAQWRYGKRGPAYRKVGSRVLYTVKDLNTFARSYIRTHPGAQVARAS